MSGRSRRPLPEPRTFDFPDDELYCTFCSRMTMNKERAGWYTLSQYSILNVDGEDYMGHVCGLECLARLILDHADEIATQQANGAPIHV